MKYYQFVGHINLMEPFYVNTPNTNRFPKDSRGNPLIPARTIRGWLRFASYRSLLEVFKREDVLFSIHEHYLLAKGIDTGSLIQNSRATNIGANAEVRKENPMMDLYGRWGGMAGALGVGNATASKENLVRLGDSSRGHIADEFEGISDFLHNDDLELLQQMALEDSEFSPEIRGLREQIKDLNFQFRNTKTFEQRSEINEKIALINSQIDGIKARKVGSKETMRRVVYANEVLDRGTTAAHTMRITSAHESSFKFFIWTISKLPLFKLGGLKALNHGDANPIWRVIEHSFENVGGRDIGVVGWSEKGFEFSLNDGYAFDLKDFEHSLLASPFNFRSFG